MNTKFSFISNENLPEPTEIIKKQLTTYSQIVENLDQHYALRNQLTTKWNSIIKQPEYDVVKEESKFLIVSLAERITIATVQDESLANNIVELMNLAYREGAKQIIQVLETL